MITVEKALIKAFSEMKLVDDEFIHYENEDFQHPGNKNWLKVTFVPNDPIVRELGDEGSDNVTGFLQVDLNAPMGEGRGELVELFQRIRRRFTAGTLLEYDCTQVTITSTARSSGRIVDDFYRITARISFYSRINRTQNK